jgi:hemoglobin
MSIATEPALGSAGTKFAYGSGMTLPPISVENTHFNRIGGEAAIARLAERFYEAMQALPQARAIRDLHPAELAASREKLLSYLVGWMGGPPRYVERHGPPRLRQRHLAFPIGAAERDAWLQCMDAALDEVVGSPGLKDELRQSFRKVAAALVNTGSEFQTHSPLTGKHHVHDLPDLPGHPRK